MLHFISFYFWLFLEKKGRIVIKKEGRSRHNINIMQNIFTLSDGFKKIIHIK